jgi:hypothetical protein
LGGFHVHRRIKRGKEDVKPLPMFPRGKNMSNIMTPDNIQAALDSLESELSSLTGNEAWGIIKDEFHTLKPMLRDRNDPEIHGGSGRVGGTSHYVNVKISRSFLIHKRGAYHV